MINYDDKLSGIKLLELKKSFYKQLNHLRLIIPDFLENKAFQKMVELYPQLLDFEENLNQNALELERLANEIEFIVDENED